MFCLKYTTYILDSLCTLISLTRSLKYNIVFSSFFLSFALFYSKLFPKIKSSFSKNAILQFQSPISSGPLPPPPSPILLAPLVTNPMLFTTQHDRRPPPPLPPNPTHYTYRVSLTIASRVHAQDLHTTLLIISRFTNFSFKTHLINNIFLQIILFLSFHRSLVKKFKKFIHNHHRCIIFSRFRMFSILLTYFCVLYSFF